MRDDESLDEDRTFTEQAVYLSAHSDLSRRAAEAYLRYVHAVRSSDTPASKEDIADDTDISRSTFSRYLSTSRNALESDSNSRNVVSAVLSTTPVGGAGGFNRQVVAVARLEEGLFLLSESRIAADSEAEPLLKAHPVYPEDVGVPDEDAPTDESSPDEWGIPTVGGPSAERVL
jgi:hypothetical protein